MVGGAPTIGNDVFIGCHATILGEIRIGDGARIGPTDFDTWFARSDLKSR